MNWIKWINTSFIPKENYDKVALEDTNIKRNVKVHYNLTVNSEFQLCDITECCGCALLLFCSDPLVKQSHSETKNVAISRGPRVFKAVWFTLKMVLRGHCCIFTVKLTFAGFAVGVLYHQRAAQVCVSEKPQALTHREWEYVGHNEFSNKTNQTDPFFHTLKY